MKAVGSSKPVVVVLLNGGALAVDWIQGNVPAIVEAFYPGKVGSSAVSDVLFGNYNPGGKLPYTIYDGNFTSQSDFLSMNMTAPPGRGYR